MTSTLATALNACQAALAATPAMQAWLGVAPPAGFRGLGEAVLRRPGAGLVAERDLAEIAAEKIYLHRLPGPETGDTYTAAELAELLPFAILGPPEHDGYRIGMAAIDTPRCAGTFEVQLFQASPAAAEGEEPIDDQEADADWFDTIGDIIEGFVDQAIADGFPLRGRQPVRIFYGPWRPSQREAVTSAVEMCVIVHIDWGRD